MEQYADPERPENLRESANFLSAFVFWWTYKIFKIGAKRDLNESDIPSPLDEHKSGKLGEKISRLWSTEYQRAKRKHEEPSLSKVIRQCFFREYFTYGLALMFIELLVKPFQPLFLGLLVRFFTDYNSENTNPLKFPMYMNRIFYYNYPNQSAIQLDEAILYASGIVICSLISVLVQHPFMCAVMHLGMKIRVACMSLLYRKTLRMSMLALSPATVGNVVNLMSNDATRFDIAPMYCHYLWISPLQILLFMYLLYFHIGSSTFIGLSVIFLFIPIQLILAYINKDLRWKTAFKTDERVRLMNEIIAGIQVIKMYAWEYAFTKLIDKSRRREMSMLVQTSYIRGLIMSMIMFTSRCATFVALISYVLLFQNHINSEKTFVLIGYFTIMRSTMTVYFPQGVTQFAETLITIKRTKDYLMNEDACIGNPAVLDPAFDELIKQVSGSEINMSNVVVAPEEKPSIRIIEAYARWNFGHHVLRNIEFSIGAGQLFVIIGKIGSGKTSLVHVFLKELPLSRGYISVKGVISYASKDPWLFAGSVRQNILFGNTYDRIRYKKVVRVCALSRDFQLLPYGDQTVVGERGISLSGGQRARINLARCVYKEADVYIMDDPLSAVDTQVGSQIFDECITGFLKNKIRILVSHQLQYMTNSVDQIVIMDKGQVLAKGTFNELQRSGLNLSMYLEDETSADKKNLESELSTKEIRIRAPSIQISNTEGGLLQYIELKRRSSLIEQTGTGTIAWINYKLYMKAGGNFFVIFVVIFGFLFTQGVASAGDYIIGQWVKLEDVKYYNVEPGNLESDFNTDHYIILYSALTLLLIIMAIVRSLIFFTVCVRASVKLHDAMFESICKAEMRFFNTNPSGRILNRFSKDMGAVDEDLPYAMCDFFQMMLNLVGVVIVLALTNYILIIPIILVTIGIVLLRSYYLKTSRNVKRIEGAVRSHIFAHLNASIQGLSTIRTHLAEEILTYEFDKHSDLHSSTWYIFICTTRAFSLWMDLLCVSLIFLGTFGLIFFKLVLKMNIFAGDVGLIITQCLMLTGLIPWGMRQSAEMENQMTSVERILEYIDVKSEPPFETPPDKKPPPDWPTDGGIIFHDLELRYSLKEVPVLKKLNLLIFPGEKIGIVGRTGAGKSSLISALFRLAFQSGAIIIDGIDIFKLGLHDVRKRICIIPQEPIIFTGTYRFNLDPFKEFPDKVLLTALTTVDLETGTRNILAKKLTEGDANFSTGQKQLLCLARAIVRNCRILILDEATANMDPHTDRLIQTIIRTQFAHCTILTIAHRLRTIMDSDRVLVIQAGKAVEFNHPHLLLQNSNGEFTKMVEQNGKKTADILRRIAERTYLHTQLITNDNSEIQIIPPTEEEDLNDRID